MLMELRSFSLQELAELTGAQLVGDPNHCITGIDALETATGSDVSFLANLRYKSMMERSAAGVICIDETIPRSAGKNYLISKDPSATFQVIAKALLSTALNRTGFQNIHPSAVIHPDAIVSSDAHIGPCAVVDQGACIGARTRLFPHVYVGAYAQIGSDCLLHAHATVREGCILQDRVVLQPGAVIGSCGFGFSTNASGEHSKQEQLGIVILEEDVEVGANTTIDRARFKVTRIGKGTKIDNLVQIGHNVSLGRHNIIVSQTGISGSTTTGRNVVLGGQTGVVGHIHIGDGVMVAARGGISKSITTPGKYAGVPVMELGEHNRQQVLVRKISQFVKRIEALEQQIRILDAQVH